MSSGSSSAVRGSVSVALCVLFLVGMVPVTVMAAELVGKSGLIENRSSPWGGVASSPVAYSMDDSTEGLPSDGESETAPQESRSVALPIPNIDASDGSGSSGQADEALLQLAGNEGEWSEARQFTLEISELIQHGPIDIEGDDDFTSANGVVGGSGTENDPYLIEGWEIDSSSATGVHIKDTTAYFIVRNCLVENGKYAQDAYKYGVYLENVQNGRVENTISENNLHGIFLSDSATNNILANNTVSNNSSRGIYLRDSDNNTLANNTLNLNGYDGTYLKHSSNNIIENNIADSNGEYGIYLVEGSSNNTLINNTNLNNGLDGIRLWDSNNNTIDNNTADSNGEYGVILKYSHNNILANNTASNNEAGIILWESNNNLIYNNYLSNTYNAWDDSTNIWNIDPTPGTNIVGGPYLGGNYWSDYAGVDTDGNGLGDTELPYNSSGEIKNGGDYHPLVLDTTPPPAPTLLEPEDGATIATSTPTFRWTQPEAFENYTLVIDDNADFSSPAQMITDITDNTYTLTSPLADGAYYWRVRAVDGAGNEGEWSDIFEFEVTVPIVPGKPTLVSPQNGSSIDDSTPTFEWVIGANAESHRLLVDDSSNFSSPEEDVSLGPTDSTYTVEDSLADGTYSWKVIAIKGAYESSSDVWTFTVVTGGGGVTNFSPTANFTYSPPSPSVSETIQFTDSSSDGDGIIVVWSWNFGDETTSTEQNPTHSYAEEGTYTVTLTVTDDDGATGSVSKDIKVTSAPTNQPPTASFTYSPSNPTTASMITFDASSSSDPDGYITNYEWSFGDGSSGTGVTTTHSYSVADNYTVTLTVTDNGGLTDSYTSTVTVSAPTPEEIENMSAEEAAEILVALDPEVAADLLEAISLDKCTAIVQVMIEQGWFSYIDSIFQRLTADRVNGIWSGLTEEQRNALLPYLSPEVKDKILGLGGEGAPWAVVALVTTGTVAPITVVLGRRRSKGKRQKRS